MLKKSWWVLLAALLGLTLIAAFGIPFVLGNKSFDGERAYRDVLHQVELGPRTPGSAAHAQTIQWISNSLESSGWQVELQHGEVQGHALTNIIGSRGSSHPWIILGAHYDSRLVADLDPDVELRTQAVSGANDGASGVAVLLELARVLPKDDRMNISLVFFDLEDQGNIEDWDWILGSRYFAAQLKETPDSVVIIDMIGDKDLNIYYEGDAKKALSNAIWQVAKDHGYSQQFIPSLKYSILDDHTPFIQKGIDAVLLIDFDYPYWHTTEDTVKNISSSSLKAVGQTLFEWIKLQK